MKLYYYELHALVVTVSPMSFSFGEIILFAIAGISLKAKNNIIIFINLLGEIVPK